MIGKSLIIQQWTSRSIIKLLSYLVTKLLSNKYPKKGLLPTHARARIFTH